MPGIFERLGSFGTRIINRVIETGRTIAEVVGFLKPLVPDVTDVDVAREYGRVTVEKEYAGGILDLNPHTVIPESLSTPTDIPFKRPFAYKVVVFGRYLKGMVVGGESVGGRFAHEEWDLPVSRELTKEEVVDMAKGRLGKAGGSARMEIFSIEVVAAYFREET